MKKIALASVGVALYPRDGATMAGVQHDAMITAGLPSRLIAKHAAHPPGS